MADALDPFAGSQDTVLIASGAYQYALNGQIEDIAEPWLLYHSQAGWLLRSDRVVPAAGLHIKTQSCWCAGILQRVDIGWYQGGVTSPQRLVRYRCDNQGRSIIFEDLSPSSAGGTETMYQDSRIQLFPLMRIYMGSIISGLLQQGGTGQVLVPWIKDPLEPQRLLTPSLSERRVEVLGDELIEVDGERVQTQCFAYQGEQYGEGSRFWLCNGVLQQYCWTQEGVGDWVVSLTQRQFVEPKAMALSVKPLFESWT